MIDLLIKNIFLPEKNQRQLWYGQKLSYFQAFGESVVWERLIENFITANCFSFFRKLTILSAQLKANFSQFQALEWIHDTGEFYLSTHTNVGESLAETESLLKEHNEFKVTAKVSVNFYSLFIWTVYMNGETSF